MTWAPGLSASVVPDLGSRTLLYIFFGSWLLVISYFAEPLPSPGYQMPLVSSVHSVHNSHVVFFAFSIICLVNLIVTDLK